MTAGVNDTIKVRITHSRSRPASVLWDNDSPLRANFSLDLGPS